MREWLRFEAADGFARGEGNVAVAHHPNLIDGCLTATGLTLTSKRSDD